MIIGSHISIAKGYPKAAKDALSIGANTFQFFTRNPRGGKARKLDPIEIDKLRLHVENGDLVNLLAHAPYTMNLASKNESTLEFGRMILKEDIKRLSMLPCNLYVFHPGSHTGQGIDEGINKIVDALNAILTGDEELSILLETMSGKGTEIGSTFEELKMIIDGVNFSDRLGVCLDTCHLYSAGYDIVNNLEGVLTKFDKKIGLNKIKAIHLNNSKTDFNSHKDRHDKIKEGTIDIKLFENIINIESFKNVPFILETPNELEGYTAEIKMLRSLSDS